MSEEQQLRTVKKMINAGMYDEARAALLTIDHPLAEKWLQKLDQISPPTYKTAARKRSRPQPKPKDKNVEVYYPDDPEPIEEPPPSRTSPILIIGIFAIIGVLLVGGVIMLTQGEGFEPPITTDNTSCGGQEWINSIDGSFNELYRYNLWDLFGVDENTYYIIMDETLRDQQIKDLEARLERVEQSVAPDCLAGARDKMIEAYEAQIQATEIVDVDNPINAFGLFGKTLRLMKEAATEMVEVGGQFRRVDSAAINQLLDEGCPAFEYVTRTMYVDNQFLVMMFVDPQIQSLDAYYSFVNDLSQQYYRVKDDPNVPPCMWATRDQFVQLIESTRGVFEAALGSDINGMYYHSRNATAAWEQLFVEIEKAGLNPAQFGGEFEFVLLEE